MASYLAPYGNFEALRVARELDAKVEEMLMDIARPRSAAARKDA